MRRFKLSPSAFFKLFVAAATFALGLAAAGLWPRQRVHVSAPPAVAAPARAEVSVRDTAAEEETDEGPRRFAGVYENYVYGYSVRLPAGVVASGSAPPAPDHGFGIDLGDPGSTAWNGRPDFPPSYLYVDGSYNSYDWERLDDAVESRLEFLREKGRGVRVLSRAETRLGGLRALRVVARYERGGVEMMSDEVVAFGEEASPVYTLSLTTPRSKYERDRPVLEALMEGWRLQPVR